MTTTDHPQTNGGRLLKRGDTQDFDCWRTTHRLGVGQTILRNLGFTPTWPDHSDECIKSEKNRIRRVWGYNYMCDDPKCPMRTNPDPTWPEGASGEVFDKAYALACAVQDERGRITSKAVNEIQRERREAARAGRS